MASGWWDLDGAIASCVAAYQPVGAASYAASKVNLANAGTYDAVDGTAYPTWNVATGCTFNGTTQYLKTGIVLLSNYTVIIRYSGVGSPLTYRFMAGGDTLDHRFALGFSNTTSHYMFGTSYANTRGTIGATGVIALAANQGYLNGTADGAAIAGTWGGTTPTKECYIGAINNNGTLANYSNYNNLAISIYNAALNATQIGLLTTAMNALPVSGALLRVNFNAQFQNMAGGF